MEPSPKPTIRLPWPLLGVAAAAVGVCLLAGLAFAALGAGMFNRLARTQKASSSIASLSPQEAQIQDLNGLVEVQQGQSGWRASQEGDRVAAGALVRTGSLSSASLVFKDGSQVSLGAGAQISLDEINASNPRVIALTQVQGESDHQVATSKAQGSRYEVHTAGGVAVAKGTRFRVSVTPEQSARFIVKEGIVAVTGAGDPGAQQTVEVHAGEITLLAPNAAPTPPVFYVTGEGLVSQTGATWIIGEQSFEVTNSTILVGDPKVNDRVFVEGRMLSEDRRVADLIVVEQYAQANHFSFTGEVQEISDQAWTVAAQTVIISATTEIEPGIIVGDQVRVEGMVREDGSLVAAQIHRLEVAAGQAFDFTGVAQAILSDTWQVSGIMVHLNADTQVDPALVVGDLVRVRGFVDSNGDWWASSLQAAGDAHGEFEFSGPLESVSPWKVAGLAFETREWTEIDPDLKVGDWVHVEGQILADGTWVASEISLLAEPGASRLVIVGTVISRDPWVVSGLPLTVISTTVIGPGIQAGSLVRVEILLLPDGSQQVLSIQLVPGLVWTPGCMVFSGTVISVAGSQIQLAGWPVLVLAEGVVIPENLAPNQVVQFVLCFTPEHTLQITSIIIVIDIGDEGEGEPPVGEEGKITVCHKPDKKGGHSITISRSALPAHLGHGDRIGDCSSK